MRRQFGYMHTEENGVAQSRAIPQPPNEVTALGVPSNKVSAALVKSSVEQTVAATHVDDDASN
jgi:hypothetical protein